MSDAGRRSSAGLVAQPGGTRDAGVLARRDLHCRPRHVRAGHAEGVDARRLRRGPALDEPAGCLAVAGARRVRPSLSRCGPALAGDHGHLAAPAVAGDQLRGRGKRQLSPHRVVARGSAAGRAGLDGRRRSQSLAGDRSVRRLSADAVLHCRIGARVAARSTRRCRAGRRQPHVLHGGEPGPGLRRVVVGRRGAEHRQSLRPRRRRRHGLRAQRRPAARQAARRRAERARARGGPGRRRGQSRHLDERHRPRQRAGEQEVARAVRLCVRRPARRRAAGAAGSCRRPRGVSRPIEPGSEKARRIPERVSPRPARRPAALDRRPRARRLRRQGQALAQPRRVHRHHREEGRPSRRCFACARTSPTSAGCR